jgi:hypothetical protein
MYRHPQIPIPLLPQEDDTADPSARRLGPPSMLLSWAVVAAVLVVGLLLGS